MRAGPLILDSDVLIDYLRGRQNAVAFLEGLEEPLLVSAISVAELSAGVKGPDEERAFEGFLLAFDVLPVDAGVARLGGAYRRQYGPSHGTGLADALIAATAVVHAVPLVTLNVKHFPMLTDVRRPY